MENLFASSGITGDQNHRGSWRRRVKLSRRQFMAGIVSAIGLASAGKLLGSRMISSIPERGSAPETNYLRLHRQGKLVERGQQLWAMMEKCCLCPRSCGAKRLKGERGFCQANANLEVSSYNPHFGEERPLVGRGGSGTIFFTHCGLRCVFCINWEISQESMGRERKLEELAEMMLKLQGMGCHNINVVTPTHYAPHIVKALEIAAGKGLAIPLVYNTCGWERLEILRILDGVVDIYLPDFKYSEAAMAKRYSSGAETYPEITKAALLEMQRQVGTVKLDSKGVACRGLMIRHLVMPNNVGGTKEVMEWIAANLPKDTYVNIMSQYTPVYKASSYPEIARRISRTEYAQAVQWAKKCGLTNLDIQGMPF
jgi:putative pyruvate formate lyase activating enzyme